MISQRNDSVYTNPRLYFSEIFYYKNLSFSFAFGQCELALIPNGYSIDSAEKNYDNIVSHLSVRIFKILALDSCE